jgi:hypothetical protein
MGGEFPAWQSNGRIVHWSIGNALVTYDLDRARAFDDSVRVARRNAAPADSAARRDTTSATYKPTEVRVRVTAPRDISKGVVVLRGARAVTMKGNEVINGADIVVRDNRIVGIGRRGSVSIPAGARIINVSGKTIVPGRGHPPTSRSPDIHGSPGPSANLTGVTTRDPQTGSTDVLSYATARYRRPRGPAHLLTGPGAGGERIGRWTRRNVLKPQ